MHSRKSIFYRGIVFIVSIFAMAIFSQVTVGAACGVKFVDDAQYLTFGGGNSTWSDKDIELNADCTTQERDSFKRSDTSVYVNGNKVNSFVPTDYAEGHYTIAYNYELNGKNGTIYRYVRILNPNFNTTQNFTLGVFDAFKVDAEGNSETQIVNAFYDSSSKMIINFVSSNDSTYIVITNLTGKELLRQEVLYDLGTKYDVRISEVVKGTDYYYIVGNTNLGGIIKIIEIDGITIKDVITANASTHNSSSVYNGAYYVSNNEIYLAGNDTAGNPIIDVYKSTIENFYTYTGAKGSYNGVIAKFGVVYGVGYTSSGIVTKGLYSSVPKTDTTTASHSTIFDEDSKFTKIIRSSDNHNIIIGETKTPHINAGGTVSAINTREGYSDAFVLELSNDALTYTQARMYGSSENDVFNNIVNVAENKYILTGVSTNGSISMAYEIDIRDFSSTEQIVSGKNTYHVNGAIATPYGVSYYGKIYKNTEKIIDVYYPKTITTSDPLLLVLDNRKFTTSTNRDLTNEVISLVKITGTPTEDYYKYCYYNIKFNSDEKKSEKCIANGVDAYIPSSTVTPNGIGELLKYEFVADSGVTIIVYRTIVITEAPTPIDLDNTNKTGILKWYTYSRGSAYTASTAVRLNPNNTTYMLNETPITYTANFKYYMDAAVSGSDIFDMIANYINAGTTNGFTMASASESDSLALTFEHSNQTTAAFASIEYAKMFAYYQEFSKVIKVNLRGSQRGILGESLYSGQYIDPNADHYYIYYIDFSGSNTNGLIDSCKVTNTSISNCTGKAGYAFADLRSINTVIKDLLAYNNYFVSTRNTIYNGSVAVSEIEKYKQELYTPEYVKMYGEPLRSATMNLTFNVYELVEGGEERLIYQGSMKDVYFGLKKEDGIFKYNDKEVKDLVAATGDLYYFNDKAAYIMKNACYEIYYSYESNVGRSKIFCLDNTPPKIIYHEEQDEIGVNKVHNSTSTKGNDSISPLYIGSDFTIVGLDDLDDYAYIMINRVVYPMTCSDKSVSCLAHINEYIRQTFRYNRKDPTKINSVSFADRSGNGITFYFVVGTEQPSLSITELTAENKGTKDNPEWVTTSFSLVINFYETNSIKDFQIVGLSRQNCGTIVDQSNACYKEETEEEIANTIFSDDVYTSIATKEFNEMVTNYIKAVSYRDRENLDGIIVLNPTAEGTYENPINHYTYKMENGYFVEISGYEETYKLFGQKYIYDGEEILLENNYFVRNETIYAYEEGVIQAKEIVAKYDLLDTEPSDWADNYKTYYYASGQSKLPNTNSEFTPAKYYRRRLDFENKGSQIVLNPNNEFQFDKDSNRVYRLVIELKEEDSYIEALPVSYKLEKDNTFRIDYDDSNGRIIYSYNPTSGLIEYANPLTQTSKRIELIFTRTTKVSGGVPTGGVDVPYTVPKYKTGTQTIEIDPLTGLEIYTFDPEAKVKHFNIVDGVYTFNITQNLDFGSVPSETGSIYVTKLDLKIGYSKEYPGVITPADSNYSKIYGLPLDFTGLSTGTTHLDVFDNQFIYPFGGNVVNVMSQYGKTYFSKNSVFVGFTVKETAVFTIKISKERSSYGLPVANQCQEIVILGSGFKKGDSIPVSKTCTNDLIVMYLPEIGFPATDIDYTTLEENGIYELISGGGAYLFSGINTFYEISLFEYNKENAGAATVLLKETFYIDNVFKQETVSGMVSIVDTDAQGNPKIDAGNNTVLDSTNNPYVFKTSGKSDEYALYNGENKETIGGIYNVEFDFSFYDRSADDLKENRLLIAHIIVDGKTNSCNVYRAMTDAVYANECSGGYIDQTLSANDDINNVSRLVFSQSGDYKVIFEDASKNRVSYEFAIDKSAPEIQLDAVDNGNTDFKKDPSSPTYEIEAFTKNPSLEVTIKDDLSRVTSYCYKFTYVISGSSVTTKEECPSVANDSNELKITINMDNATVGNDSTPLIEALTNLRYDGNVRLTVTSADGLGNKTEKNMVVNFWADYSNPTFTETESYLNKQYQTYEEITANDAKANTITVLANEYIGRTFACGLEGFKFKDPRYVSTQSPYTYVINCEDYHNTTAGSYPLVNGFSNTISMVFYEVELVDDGDGNITKQIKVDGEGKPVYFQFGVPTGDRDARWIAIKVRDFVGNESDEVAYIPIFVSDDIKPTIVENGVNKCIRLDGPNCVEWEVINYTEYLLKDEIESKAYLANSRVKVQLSEYIWGVQSCITSKYLKDSDVKETIACEYITGTKFKYEDAKTEFIFNTEDSEINSFKIIRIVLYDFAGLPSDEIVIVIDRINPEIEFVEGKGNDVQIEYAMENESFDERYGYKDDLSIIEDQGTAQTNVTHEFYRYAPLLTYKNYIRNAGGFFEKVPDYTEKGMETYYLLIDQREVTDKECVAPSEDSNYCYVVDVANTYYFDELLIDNERNNIQVWTNIGLDKQVITKINGLSGIAVYKIAYQVVDFAGNKSEILYKKVFVVDTKVPEINIYDDDGNLLYENIAITNPDFFDGKITSSVTFTATDTPTTISNKAKILFYTCSIDDYVDNPQTCPISSDVLFRKDRFGQYNSYAFRRNAANGVYKAFAYDTGKYTKKDLIHSTGGDNESVYVLTRNVSTAYFVINRTPVKANFKIYGNRVTTDYKEGNSLSFQENPFNYIEIYKKEGLNDVKLMSFDKDSNTYTDISKTSSIGYSTVTNVGFAGDSMVTVSYKDAKGNVIYEIKYEKANIIDGVFMVHESYYYLTGTDTIDSELCIVGKGKSKCEQEGNQIYTYVVSSVIARIYENGVYSGLSLVDNYGNSSEILENPLYVDNEPYTTNKNNNVPTGINYWFSVPKYALTRENVAYYRELLVPVYSDLTEKPSDWEAEYQSYFAKDGENYIPNTNPEYMDNTYYSRDYVLDDNVNVTNPKYDGNFNSSFFYAIASEEEAKKYMAALYDSVIRENISSGYTFYDAFGTPTNFDPSETVESVKSKISASIYDMIIPTFVEDKKFSDAAVKQVEYTGEISPVTNAMYQYTYIIRTRSVVNGKISYTYSFAGDTCNIDEQDLGIKECIKVNLKIVSGVNVNLNVSLNENEHNLSCVSIGLTMSNEVQNNACINNITFASKKEATIVYIDKDKKAGLNQYHENVVYYGFRIYSESSQINYVEAGTYVPMDKITRYDNDHNENENGDYIWINSTWVNLENIINTNLYTTSCSFGGRTYNNGCVFVSYLSKYEWDINKYKPSEFGTFYFDYYRNDYFDNKEELIESMNGYSDKDIEFDYSKNGRLCSNQGNCEMIPVYVKETEIKNISLNNETGDEKSYYLNKKTYVELFNSKDTISRLFEVSMIVRGGIIAEKYSYATLYITKDGVGKYYNINSKIIHIDGYTKINNKPSDWETSYDKFYIYQSGAYVANTSSEWRTNKYFVKDAIACIIDIDLESKYSVSVTDSAGNRIVLNFQHTEKIPTLSYKKITAETNSGVEITVHTDSKVTGLNNDEVHFYKYNLEDEVYELINAGTCYYKETSTTGGRVSTLKFTLNYHADYNCVGVYKIEARDMYGNSSYKEIVFNPYVTNDLFNTNIEGNVNKTATYDDKHLIASNFFTIDINSNLSYVNIYKYPAYSNLTLENVEAKDIQKITILDFARSNQETIGTCTIRIDNKNNGIYRLSVVTDADHSCDGVYKIEVINVFSDSIKRIERFASLEGANELILTSEKPSDWEYDGNKYYYYDVSGKLKQVKGSPLMPTWEEGKYYTQKIVTAFALTLAGGDTIEIDSLSPDVSVLAGNNQNFNLYLDDSEFLNAQDTRELLESPTKSIEYTNTFVTVAWGGYASYSMASLHYRYKTPDMTNFSEEWTVVSENVKYQTPYTATFKFAPGLMGLNEYQFKFVDAVGNENAEGIYTIKIMIDPPHVGFFEVVENPITGLPDRENSGTGPIRVDRQYDHGERIPKQTILKCIDGGYAKDCNINDYTYSMVVNENNYPAYSTQDSITLPINQDSPFLWTGNDGSKPEIVVKLTVSIKGKPSIATELLVIIDRKAPDIDIVGEQATNTTTFINSVVVSLDQDDQTNVATIYKCDAIVDDLCMDKLPNGDLVEGGTVVASIEKGQFAQLLGNNYSGYFMVIATDDPVNLGNESRRWFALDNEAPTIDIRNDLTSIAPYMYTNANNVKAYVIDELSAKKATIKVEFVALLKEDKELEATMTYDSLLGLTKQGKYTLTPIDAVGHEGESITFYIYRESPKYELSGDGNAVRKDVVLSWPVPENELIAPVVSVTLDGAMYNATYNKKEAKYIGTVVEGFGEHTFVIVDAAGNRSLVMATINTTNNVCIDGKLINVKRQYNYQIDSLIVGGKEQGYSYAKDDVIIFALPSQATGKDCVSKGLLGYRTIDPQNSHFLISADSVAARMNNNQYDLVEQGFVSKQAVDEINNIGGTVVVFVVTKDIANHTLGYNVGTNFFMEDPLGWTMIFMTAILSLIPGYRIFVKKKVRVI